MVYRVAYNHPLSRLLYYIYRYNATIYRYFFLSSIVTIVLNIRGSGVRLGALGRRLAARGPILGANGRGALSCAPTALGGLVKRLSQLISNAGGGGGRRLRYASPRPRAPPAAALGLGSAGQPRPSLKWGEKKAGLGPRRPRHHFSGDAACGLSAARPPAAPLPFYARQICIGGSAALSLALGLGSPAQRQLGPSLLLRAAAPAASACGLGAATAVSIQLSDKVRGGPRRPRRHLVAWVRRCKG